MSKRRMTEKAEIERSATFSDNAPQKPKPRTRQATSLYQTWGADDCNFFFRWAAAGIGFKGQGIAPQAETKAEGRRLLALWDHATSDAGQIRKNLQRIEVTLGRPDLSKGSRERLLRQRLALTVQLTKAGVAGEGGNARPGSMGGTRVRTNPDRLTEDNLAAAKRYGRIQAGMSKLGAADYAVLKDTFLPMPVPPEVQSAFGAHFGWLAMKSARLVKSYARAADGVTFETWLLRKIEKKDELVRLALADTEALAEAAVKAYEACAETPPEILRAQKEKAEAEDRPSTPRAPRVRRAPEPPPFIFGGGE